MPVANSIVSGYYMYVEKYSKKSGEYSKNTWKMPTWPYYTLFPLKDLVVQRPQHHCAICVRHGKNDKEAAEGWGSGKRSLCPNFTEKTISNGNIGRNEWSLT